MSKPANTFDTQSQWAISPLKKNLRSCGWQRDARRETRIHLISFRPFEFNIVDHMLSADWLYQSDMKIKLQ